MEALVTTDGKEKARKPVDPPPIVELIVDQNADPNRIFLNSPYLFVVASLYNEDKTPQENNGASSLAGTLVSSLHRLKNMEGNDSGYFVLGDISVKVIGRHRLNFALYEFTPETSEMQYLTSVCTTPFEVVPAKSSRGLTASTFLSQHLADQGVRLRLRKEQRATMPHKRSCPSPEEEEQLPDKRIKMPLQQQQDLLPFLPAYPGYAGYEFQMPFPQQ